MVNDLKESFLKGARGALKYGYFAPLTAAWLALNRRGFQPSEKVTDKFAFGPV